MSTGPEDAVARAREKTQELGSGFQALLEKIGIEGWRLISFRIRPEPEGQSLTEATACPPGTEYDCRYVDGRIECGCYPKK
jgi:hypothetical protein